MATKKRTYWNSNHRWTYIWIAIKHFTTPTRVYELAHGNIEVHQNDRKIMHSLKVRGIISRMSGSEHGHHHHHHSK